MDIILALIKNIRLNNIDLLAFDIGYCVYIAALLQIELDNLNIKNTILIGEYFKDTNEGRAAETWLKTTLYNLPDLPRKHPLYLIQRKFQSRNNELPDITCHTVVLVGNDIYDITLSDILLPTVYHLSDFTNTWQNIYKAKIVIDDPKYNFGIVGISKTKFNINEDN